MRARHAAAPFALTLLAATLTTVGFAPPAQAATIEVTTTDDENDGAGDCPGPDCSLREALQAAGDGDVVVLAADTTYELTMGHLEVGAAGLIVIEGNGATIEQTGDNARVIYRTDGDLTIRDLTVTGGDVQFLPAPDFAHGGGIRFYGDGTLTLERSLVVGNEASGDGGGIHATRIRLVDSAVVQNTGENGGGISLDLGGLLELTRSRVLGNVAETTGGGVYVGDPGPALSIAIEASTISQNTGEAVGGMYVREGDATIVNTSFLDNVATGRDSIGGLYVGGAATLRHVTLAGNEGEDAGNLGAVELRPFAVALAEPVGAPSCSIGGEGTASEGYNLADDDSCGLTAPTDQPGVSTVGLGPIAMSANLHRPPLAGSPLLDVVPAAACGGPDGDLVDDQLSTPRPQGTGCDAGAIEVVVAGQPTTTTTTGPATQPAAPAAVPATAEPSFTG